MVDAESAVFESKPAKNTENALCVFLTFEGYLVMWPDGTTETVDAIVTLKNCGDDLDPDA